MNDPNIAEKLVEALARPDGSPKLRPVHAIGIGATGHFVASDVARDYCVAEHFQGEKIDVTVRFSNGSGSATQHDGWSDVRGMATRFHLAEGAATDLIAMTLPEFFTPTPETFLDFAVTAKPAPYLRESPWRKILDMLRLKLPMRNPYPGETISPDAGAIRFADQNKYAQLAVFEAASIGAPVSYARASYHAVHAFILTAPDGTRRWVRFTWQPVAGVLSTDPEATPVDRYLQKELRDRLDSRTRSLLTYDVDRRERRRLQRSLAPVAAASPAGHDGNAHARGRSRRSEGSLRTFEFQSLASDQRHRAVRRSRA